jgi:hypothetical protein
MFSVFLKDGDLREQRADWEQCQRTIQGLAEAKKAALDQLQVSQCSLNVSECSLNVP